MHLFGSLEPHRRRHGDEVILRRSDLAQGFRRPLERLNALDILSSKWDKPARRGCLVRPGAHFRAVRAYERKIGEDLVLNPGAPGKT